MTVLFTNNASTTLAATLNAAATAMTVASGQGSLFPNPIAPDYCYVTLINNSNAIEVVKCTSRTGDVLTIVRGQDGTAAKAYAIGDKVELRPTAAALTDMQALANGSVTLAKLAANSVDASKIVDGSVTNTELAAGVALANLGYTPLQSGGGVGQAVHSIKFGYDDTQFDLTSQVDVTVIRMLSEDPIARPHSGGYRGYPQSVVAGNRTLVITDFGNHLLHNVAGTHTITIPDDTALSTTTAGNVVMIANTTGSGTLTINASGSASLYWAANGAVGARTLAVAGVCWVMKVAPNFWVLWGFGVT